MRKCKYVTHPNFERQLPHQNIRCRAQTSRKCPRSTSTRLGRREPQIARDVLNMRNLKAHHLSEVDAVIDTAVDEGIVSICVGSLFHINDSSQIRSARACQETPHFNSEFCRLGKLLERRRKHAGRQKRICIILINKIGICKARSVLKMCTIPIEFTLEILHELGKLCELFFLMCEFFTLRAYKIMYTANMNIFVIVALGNDIFEVV